jgi:hypothetical protein
MAGMLCRLSGVLGLPLLAAIALSPSARAERSCAGNIDGSVLQPLPTPMVVSFDTEVATTANPGLAQRFLVGLQSAGVTVAQKGQANTLLNMTFSVKSPATNTAGSPSGTYSDFSWVSGETAPGAGQWNIRGATLSVSAEVTDTTSQSLAWVGSLTCTIMTADPNVLAEDLGAIVGRSLKSSNKR